MSTTTRPETRPTFNDPGLHQEIMRLRAVDHATNSGFLAIEYGCLAAIIGGAIALREWRRGSGLSWWWDVPVLGLVIVSVGAPQHRFGHEAAHYTLLKNKVLNDLIGDVFCMFPIFSTIRDGEAGANAPPPHVITFRSPQDPTPSQGSDPLRGRYHSIADHPLVDDRDTLLGRGDLCVFRRDVLDRLSRNRFLLGRRDLLDGLDRYHRLRDRRGLLEHFGLNDVGQHRCLPLDGLGRNDLILTGRDLVLDPLHALRCLRSVDRLDVFVNVRDLFRSLRDRIR